MESTKGNRMGKDKEERESILGSYSTPIFDENGKTELQVLAEHNLARDRIKYKDEIEQARKDLMAEIASIPDYERIGVSLESGEFMHGRVEAILSQKYFKFRLGSGPLPIRYIQFSDVDYITRPRKGRII